MSGLSLLSRSLSSVVRTGPKAHSPCVLRGDNLSTTQAGFRVSPAPRCLFGEGLQTLSSFIKPARLTQTSHVHANGTKDVVLLSHLVFSSPGEILDLHAHRCGGTHSRLCGAEFRKTAFWKSSPAGLHFLGLIPDCGVNSPLSPIKSPFPAPEPASPPPRRVSTPGLEGSNAELHSTYESPGRPLADAGRRVRPPLPPLASPAA